MTSTSATWQGADAYQAYMGRWSRPLADLFLPWLTAPTFARWLDIGCGTGSLSAAILACADPASVHGIDPSPDFITMAKSHVIDPRATFDVADALALPAPTGSYDTVVAGLVLNHIPEPGPATAAVEMVRVTRSGGLTAAYVWDYSGEMQFIRTFWEAAAAVDPDASAHDPRVAYHICKPEPLAALFESTGLSDITVDAIDLPMHFRNFDDYWVPHTLRGPSPPQRYLATVDDEMKTALREHLWSSLPFAADGTISLIGRAWAVKGTKRTD